MQVYELIGNQTVINADVLEGLRSLPDNSVQCVVTSPPFWGLRDYGLPPVVWPDGWEGCLGLEPTLVLFVEHLVTVFDEVRRVLRPDGICFMEFGDSYACSTNGRSAKDTKAAGNDDRTFRDKPFSTATDGLKPKDLCGVPWRVALALQDAGWWLRSDIIWHHVNCMPESCTDRPTKAHSYVFMLTKSAKYHYDAEAVREMSVKGAAGSEFTSGKTGVNMGERCSNKQRENSPGRNLRTVWAIPTEPLSDEHFAAYPTALVERCLRAGTSEHGCCPECGSPWRRVVEKCGPHKGKSWHDHGNDAERGAGQLAKGCKPGEYTVETIGWQPTCDCGLPEADNAPCTVLDPFLGSGTTLLVAKRMGLRGIGVEVSEKYVEIAKRRIGTVGYRNGTDRKQAAAMLKELALFA